ncbi:hypothetical protein BZA77DRAFT_326033 [Pyronema omphalodes]|nr:hypothetical protein BZA77DRAFT_326033 [Pyronema omphalodes]
MPTTTNYQRYDIRDTFKGWHFSDTRAPGKTTTRDASYTYSVPASYVDTPKSPRDNSYHISPSTKRDHYSYQVNDMSQSTEDYQWYIEFHGRKITSYSVFNRMFYQYLPSTIGKTNDGRWMCAYESEEACRYWLQWAQDEDYDGDLFRGDIMNGVLPIVTRARVVRCKPSDLVYVGQLIYPPYRKCEDSPGYCSTMISDGPVPEEEKVFL